MMDFCTAYLNWKTIPDDAQTDQHNLDYYMKKALDCLSLVYTTKGGGVYGYMGILLSPNAYATLPGSIPWVIAKHPGEAVNYGTATTISEQEVVYELHHILVCEFHTKQM